MDRRSAAELGALMTEKLAGFQIAQALYAVAKLGIPQALLEGPRTVTDLAADAEVEEHALRRVVHTLTGQGVFAHEPDGTVSVTELGATLAPGTSGSVYGTALFWMETHYAPFAALTDLGKISDLTMLAMVGGRERTRSEFTELLARSGFVLDRVARSSVSGYSVLEATLEDS